MTFELPPGLESRLTGIETMLAEIRHALTGPQAGRQSYTVEEAAALMGRKPYTVREWCREGRVNATKRPEKRGGAELWNISSEEIARYKDEGLLPPDVTRNS
jgi:hypothetical protein